MAVNPPTSPTPPVSALEPLNHPMFRALWIAGVVSNVGTWMQNVGGTWYMTLLTTSPLLVALMQTATSLPVLLVGVPAGALADILDRRRFLLFTQGWMLAVSLLLSGLTFVGKMTPEFLLVLTFALGLGSALNTPAWQAVTPEIVPRSLLTAAVTLTGVSVNLARALGPALGGLLLAAAGPGWVFLFNSISFVGVLGVIYRWPRPRDEPELPEDVFGAMRAGWRYVRHSPPLRRVLQRAAVFISCAAALWALIPLVAQRELGLDSQGYGILYGSLGVGALFAATLLPGLRRWLPLNQLTIGAAGCFALASALLGSFSNFSLNCAVMILAGGAWMAMMSSLNVAALSDAPRWVQARSIGLYLVVFQGGMAAASAFWGNVAAQFGDLFALRVAAAGLFVGLFAGRRWPLTVASSDLSPSRHWQEPEFVVRPRPEDGPVLVLVQYRIDPTRAAEFAEAMHQLRRIRRRDGALRGNLYQDPTDETIFVESFLVESWAEHLRQHQRFTKADRAVQDVVHAFHVGPEPPLVRHLISVVPPK